jgi:3-oxoacyl-[acyl-carrier protein] reductase
VDLSIGGKRALVTGSSSGLGTVIATTLAAEGAAVAVHGRDPKRAEAVAERITGMGGTASVAIGDRMTSNVSHVPQIATAVAYLASPLADYVSGATIRVDGGAVRSVT